MYIPQKIRSTFARFIGIQPTCAYQEQYKNTQETLRCLDEDFKKRICGCRTVSRQSYHSFNTSINELHQEIKSLIHTGEVEQNADSGRVKRQS
jgi:hypothetical protein